MYSGSSIEDLRRNVVHGGISDGNDYQEINVNANRRRHWRPRRQRQGSSRTQRKVCSVTFTTCQFVFLVTISFFLLDQQTCSGIEDASLSFQRPPPPPPGPSFSTPATGTTNDYSGENLVNGYYDRDPQQGMYPPPPSRYEDGYNNKNDETQQVPRQPGSLSSSSSQGQQQQNPSSPIHYEFPIAADDNMNIYDNGGRESLSDNSKEGSVVDDDNRDMPSATSSARKDLVTRYWSTKTGQAQIQTVLGLVGYGSGSFVGKSLVGGSDVARWIGYFSAIFLVVSTWFRTPMGELSRAVGLSLILVLQRTQRIRREYPTWRYVAASVGIIRGGPRDARGRPRGPLPFPPTRNPWKYTPRSPRDPDFNMMYALVSMAMVGSIAGGNLPFIPNWIGALVGAASFSFACTWQNSHRGDLARTMGMRVVRAVSELWEIQADLQIIPKATVVSSQLIDKAMILDRKHRVKDRFLSLANNSYAQASKVAEQIQKQQRGGTNKDKNDNDNDNERDRYRGNDRNRAFRRSEEDKDSIKGEERDRDWRRVSRDAENDRFSKRGDDRRQRRRDRDDDYDNGHDRSEPDLKRRSSRRYEVENNDRDRNSASRRRENYDYDGDEESFDENEYDKKSKGFFFRRK